MGRMQAAEKLAYRLKGVRKRKKARGGFACKVLARKMTLVRRRRKAHGWKRLPAVAVRGDGEVHFG
jgi:hypothetical protein